MLKRTVFTIAGLVIALACLAMWQRSTLAQEAPAAKNQVFEVPYGQPCKVYLRGDAIGATNGGGRMIDLDSLLCLHGTPTRCSDHFLILTDDHGKQVSVGLSAVLVVTPEK